MQYYQKLKFLYRTRRIRYILDRAEIKFILANLHENNCALDIGAHKGAYTYWMHKAVGPGGRIIAFEPQIELADYLRKMIKLLGIENVTVEHSALSSAEGFSTLTVPDDGPSPGATLESGLFDKDFQSYDVPLATIDSYFHDKHDLEINLIKCDVEGHELKVFKGAEEKLNKFKPHLIFECEQRHHKNDSIQDVFDYLYNLGYKGYFFQNGQIYQLKDFDTDQSQDFNKSDYVNNFLFSAENVI